MKNRHRHSTRMHTHTHTHTHTHDGRRQCMQEIVITYTSQWKKRNGKTKESVETNWKRNMYLRLANKNEEEEKKNRRRRWRKEEEGLSCRPSNGDRSTWNIMVEAGNGCEMSRKTSQHFREETTKVTMNPTEPYLCRRVSRWAVWFWS